MRARSTDGLKEFQQDFIAQLSNQTLDLDDHFVLTQQISAWLKKEEEEKRNPPFTLKVFEKNSRNPQLLKKFFNRLSAQNKKIFAESFLNAKLKEVSSKQEHKHSDAYNVLLKAIRIKEFVVNATLQDDKAVLYKAFQKNISLVDNHLVREALIKMFNDLLILKSSKKTATQLNNLLANLNNLAIAYQQKEPSAETIFKAIEQDSAIVEKQYHKQKKKLITNRHQLQTAIAAKIRSYNHIRFEKEINLFDKTIGTDAKDAKSGAKPGGIYHMQSSDEEQKTYMVKRGNELDDTLSELLVDIEGQLTAQKLKHENITVARTHLVIEDTKHRNLEEFGKHLFLASEFSDADYAVEAFKLGGFKERPKALATKHEDFFTRLGILNQQCDLKLEWPLLTAMNTRDIDFHTGNVILNFSTESITDASKRKQALELISQLKKNIADYANTPSKTTESDKKHWADLAKQINKIKTLGGVAFFQKIDHGYGYNNYAKNLPLSTSSIFHRDQMIIGKSTAANQSRFKPTTQPSNHISEFTEKHRAKDTLFSEAGCIAILSNPEKQQIEILQAALILFYERLRIAAKSYGKSDKEYDAAEMHLLKSFYSHVTGMRYRAEGGSIKDIQDNITDYLVENRKKHLQEQRKFIKDELGSIVEKIEKSGGPENATEMLQKQLFLEATSPTPEKKLDQQSSPKAKLPMEPIMKEINDKGAQKILKPADDSIRERKSSDSQKRKPSPPPHPRPSTPTPKR